MNTVFSKVLPGYLQENEAAPIPPSDLTEWALYNDITEEIWHNPKTGLRTH
jgi:hypothetical protein